jgi:hypothetical protein
VSNPSLSSYWLVSAIHEQLRVSSDPWTVGRRREEKIEIELQIAMGLPNRIVNIYIVCRFIYSKIARKYFLSLFLFIFLLSSHLQILTPRTVSIPLVREYFWISLLRRFLPFTFCINQFLEMMSNKEVNERERNICMKFTWGPSINLYYA